MSYIDRLTLLRQNIVRSGEELKTLDQINRELGRYDGWQHVRNYPPRGRVVFIKTTTGTFGLATHDGEQWHIQEYDRKYATVDGVEKWIDVFNI